MQIQTKPLDMEQNIYRLACLSTLIYVFWIVFTLNNYIQLSYEFNKIILFLFVFSLIKETKKLSIYSSIWIWIALFVLVAFIGIQTSENYMMSSVKGVLDAQIIIVGALIYHVFHRELVLDISSFLIISVLLFLSVVAFPSVQEIYVSVLEYMGGNLTSSIELSLFSHLRHFSYVAFVFSAFSYLAFRQAARNKVYLICLGLLFLMCLACLLLAFGRGSIIAFLLFVFLLDFRVHSFKVATITTGLICLYSIVFYSLLTQTNMHAIVDHLTGQLARVQVAEVSGSLHIVSSGRIGIWGYGLSHVPDSWQFGHGVASTHWIYSGYNNLAIGQPHNVFVQWLLDFGLIGTALLLYIIYKLYFQLIMSLVGPRKSAERTKIRSAHLTIFLIAFGFYAQFDGLFYDPLPLSVFAIVSAMLMCLSERESQPS